MKKIILIFLLPLFFSIQDGIAQTAPVTTIGIEVSYGPTVSLPVTATGFSGIGSFNMFIRYDHTVINPIEVIQNSNLNGPFDVNYLAAGEIFISYFVYPQSTLADGDVVFNIIFEKVSIGTSAVTFDNQINGGFGCHYTDNDYIPIPDIDDDWIGGSVTILGLSALTWTGDISDDWSTPGNWSPTGVPFEGSLVILPPGVAKNPYPVIYANDAICNTLLIDADANLNIAPLGALTMVGDVLNNGQMTIQSSSSGDGSFIDGGSCLGSGTFTVERYLASERWHHFSSVISDGLSEIFTGLYLMEWDEPTGEYSYIVDTDVELNPTQGYSVWPDEDNFPGGTTVYFETSMENINTGEYQSIPITADGPDPAPWDPSTGPGWNFLGNPYPSAVDWDNTDGWDKGIFIDDVLYIYVSAAGNYGYYLPGQVINGVTNIIPIGQGFWVYSEYPGFNLSIAVNNNARVHDPKVFQKDTKSELQSIKLSISSELNSYSDETIVSFNEFATSNYDQNLDAYNLAGNDEAPDLFSVSTDEMNLAINTYPLLEESIIVPMNCKIGLDGYYTIAAPEIGNFDENTQILLKDKIENILIDLTTQDSYTFYASTMDIVERFDLHFLLDPVSTIEIEEDIDVRVFAVNNTIYLKSQDGSLLEGTMQVFDVLGRQIVSNKINGAYVYELPLDEHGIFIVTYFDNSTKKQYRQKIHLK